MMSGWADHIEPIKGTRPSTGCLIGTKKSSGRSPASRHAARDGFAHVSLRAARVCATALFLSLPAFAVQPDEVLKDAGLEARARALSVELRCMVCQNQSIDDSDAPLAKDLRVLVRERLVAGDSDAQVRAFLVQRYGEFVMLRPPLNASTIVLWSAPFAALASGVLIVWRLRRRASAAMAAPAAALSAEDMRRIEQLLDSHATGRQEMKKP
jgi:cytochrome c-type biogenesis protein CcmH